MASTSQELTFRATNHVVTTSDVHEKLDCLQICVHYLTHTGHINLSVAAQHEAKSWEDLLAEWLRQREADDEETKEFAPE